MCKNIASLFSLERRDMNFEPIYIYYILCLFPLVLVGFLLLSIITLVVVDTIKRVFFD